MSGHAYKYRAMNSTHSLQSGYEDTSSHKTRKILYKNEDKRVSGARVSLHLRTYPPCITKFSPW